MTAMAVMTLMFTVGCSQQRANNPSMKDGVENSLKSGGFEKVDVDEDRSKGVITIKGEVATQADKNRAESVAKAAAGTFVVANEILVTGGDEDRAEDVADASDDAIEASFEAWVEKANYKNQRVRSTVENGVLTLTGDVDTPALRTTFEKESAKIKGVTQVVNKLEVKDGRGR